MDLRAQEHLAPGGPNTYTVAPQGLVPPGPGDFATQEDLARMKADLDAKWAKLDEDNKVNGTKASTVEQDLKAFSEWVDSQPEAVRVYHPLARPKPQEQEVRKGATQERPERSEGDPKGEICPYNYCPFCGHSLRDSKI